MSIMNKLETYFESLLEADSTLKRKLGGNPSAPVSEIIGKKFVDCISILRELNIEIAHFQNLVEMASKVQPAIPAVVTELKKAHLSMIKAQQSIAKNVKDFDIVMPDKKIKKAK